MNPRDCLYCKINAFTRQFNRLVEHSFEEQSGVSLPHGNLLLMVLSQPGILSKELSTELVLASSTVTRFVDSLQRKGYVERQVSNNDGRAFRIFPTEKARGLEPRLRSARETMRGKMQERFSEAELQDLSLLMAKSLTTMVGAQA